MGWGVLPGVFAGYMFRTMQVTYAALNRTKGDTTPAKLAEALSKPVDTCCGHIEWDERHDAILPVHIDKIGADGIPVLLESHWTAADEVGGKLVTRMVK